VTSFDDFLEVWSVDFEFRQRPGERPEPLCLVAREMHSGRLLRLWRDELRRRREAPFRTDAKALFVAYLASAEMGCFLELNWQLPEYVLDLYAEFRLMTSGLKTPCGHGLLGALAYFGLPGGVDPSTKEKMRDMTQRPGEHTAAERAALLDYCQSDADGVAALLDVLRGHIERPPNLRPADQAKAFPQALQRGDYMKALAAMERRGVPLDGKELARLRDGWEDIQLPLIARVDGAYGVYRGTKFDQGDFAGYLRRNSIPWPLTPTGRLSTRQETFKEMAAAFPALAPLHELRATLSQMHDFKLAVGSDQRNRVLLADYGERRKQGLNPFGSKTGRNQPSNSDFIYGLAAWLRFLIRPEPGTALAYLDWEQQEFGIAACLSGDRNMMNAYESGDPYLAFALQAGAVPPGATKETHGAVRDQFKLCALGIQYAMGVQTLADRLGDLPSRARELLHLHRQTYSTYWRWSEACVSHAMLHGHLTATYGWRIHVGPETRPTTLRNFLLQANGSEMLRLACILAHERGLPVCAPVHDALLVEAPLDDIDDVIARTRDAMREASELVLPGFPLRVEAQVIRPPGRFVDKRGKRMWDLVQDLLVRRDGSGTSEGTRLKMTGVT
jgi:hypothetical protein